MSEKRLSQESVRELVDSLSPALRAHATRCRQIAEFILTCPRSDRIFLKRMYTEELVLAVSYHDFGKAFLPKNATDLRYCKRQSEKKAYRGHIDRAEEYIRDNSDIWPTEPTSFDRFLMECAVMHHENFDGSGYCRELKESKIPLSARLCAAVNFIDHALDFDNTEVVRIDKVAAALEAAAGRELDARICNLVLKHIGDFEALCRELHEDYKRDPDSHSHLKIRYKSRQTAFEYSPAGYDAEFSLFDTNFGEVGSEVFRAACKGETVVRMDRNVRYRVFNLIEELEEKGVDFGYITLVESAHSLRKADYARQLGRLIADYGIDASHLALGIPEELLYTNPPEIFDTLKALRKLGVRLAIDDFGQLYKTFEVFEEFRFDEIRLSRALIGKLNESNEIFQVVAGLVSVARNLAIDVSYSDVSSVEDERTLASMGVNILSGILYGGAVRADGLENSIKARAGDTVGP